MADRDPDTIKRDIDQARDQLASTVDALAERANPQRLADDAKAKVIAFVTKPPVLMLAGRGGHRGGGAGDPPSAAPADAAAGNGRRGQPVGEGSVGELAVRPRRLQLTTDDRRSDAPRHHGRRPASRSAPPPRHRLLPRFVPGAALQPWCTPGLQLTKP